MSALTQPSVSEAGRIRPTRAAILAVCGILAISAFVLGWLGTGPSWSMVINWDTASYIAGHASGTQGWSAVPWSSHVAVGQLYFLAERAAALVGATPIDGVRALNAVALAGTTLLVGLVGLSLTGDRWLGLLAGLVYLTAWGTLILVFTLEDNLLFVPPAVAVLLLAVRRAPTWRLRDSLITGALVGVATLMSWQAVLYLAAPCLVSWQMGKSSFRRVVGVVLALLGTASARAAWAAVSAALTPKIAFRTFAGVAFAQPDPSFYPSSLAEWGALTGRGRTIFRHLGLGVIQELGPVAGDTHAFNHFAVPLGIAALAICLLLVAVTRILARRTGQPAVAWLGALFVIFTLAAAVYLDLPTDKYKRFDYVPLLGALLLTVALGRWLKRHWARRILFGVVLVQLVAGFHSSWTWHQALPQKEPPGYFGPGDRQTWYGHLRNLRQTSGAACGFVFTFAELAQARFQAEIPAALWSELAHPTVIGDPAVVSQWPRPLPMRSLADVKESWEGCEWASEAARHLLFP